MPPETAVVVREDQHPIIAKIDAKMPEIAQMLPEGMHADRFRRVVVQALVRNPDLWQCTPVSVVSAIVESAQIGLEPTGVLGRAWMLPYAGEAKLIVGFRGYAELAWRADRILVKTGAVREGDEFAYQRGTDAFLRHIPALDDAEREADDANITNFWALYQLPDGRSEFEVMSRKAVERIRDKAKYKNPVWGQHFGEMGRKTVLRRLLKTAPLSPEVQRVLAKDEEIDFDTPVARVADPKRDGLRDRISQRTAALRGEPNDPGESEASAHAGGAEPEEGGPLAASSGGSPEPPTNARWMARLHAVGAERGYDHDALSEWAQRAFSVQSMKDLTTSQRTDFMEMVEKLPTMTPA
jgi:recombination protein RecT